jgi:hypothetical protein
MPDHTEIETYNYTTFEGKEDFAGFRTALQVGSAAPDFSAILLETGQPVRLSDYWREHDLVIEFGSLT